MFFKKKNKSVTSVYNTKTIIIKYIKDWYQ